MSQTVTPQLRITDAKRSLAFYVDGLGFKVDWEHQFEPGLPLFMQLTRANQSIFLTEHAGDCSVGGAVYFVVPDVDACYQEFTSRGISPSEAPEDAPWGAREMMLVDPDGNRLRFASRKNPYAPAERPGVAVARAVYEAFAIKDIPRIVSLFSPDIEIVQSTEVPWGGTYKGHEGATQFFGILTKHINSVVTVERYIDAGENIIAIGWTRGSVNESGVQFAVAVAHVWTISDGKAQRVRFCIDNPVMRAALDAFR